MIYVGGKIGASQPWEKDHEANSSSIRQDRQRRIKVIIEMKKAPVRNEAQRRVGDLLVV